MSDLFAPGFKTEPYWWDDAPRPVKNETPLPREIDVLVVGAGYTGLMAAPRRRRAAARRW